jgi:Spy/CpxP family protein refolding chaperone
MNNKIKKPILLILLALVTFGISLSAQPRERKGEIFEKVKSEKIAYLTDKLDLTEEEAQKFWPIYNQYEKEKMEIAKAMMTSKMRRPKEMTDAEASKFLDSIVDFHEKEAQIEKKYIAKFKGALPVKKVAGLLIAERDFRKVMIDNVKTRFRKPKD